MASLDQLSAQLGALMLAAPSDGGGHPEHKSNPKGQRRPAQFPEKGGGEAPQVLLRQLTEWEGRVSVAMEGISRLQEEATREAMSRSSATR